MVYGLVFAGAVVFFQNNFGCCVQVARVALIGVDVNFQLGCFVGANQDVFKGHAAIVAGDLQVHHVAVFDAVEISVCKIHVYVSLSLIHISGPRDKRQSRMPSSA